MKKHRRQMIGKAGYAGIGLRVLLAAVTATCVSGCSSATANSGADNPGVAGPPSTKYNTYIGTQTVEWSPDGLASQTTFQYGGVWALAIDDSTNFFQYENVGHQGTYEYSGPSGIPGVGATLGNLTGNGFLTLQPNGSTSGTPGTYGYALEVPGQAMALRPGNDIMPPVISVETSGCLTPSGTSTYQFISLGTPDTLDPVAHVAYGSIQASVSNVTWNFSNLKMYGFDGTDLQPAQLPTAACGETAEGFAITIAATNTPASGSTPATSTLPITAQVSPSGFFIMDQGQGEPKLFDVAPGATGPLGLVGVQQPSSQLTTSTVVAAKYLGFEFSAIDDVLGIAGTFPVSFGTVAGTGTVMTGGTYANDDVTQTPTTDITIDLGTQDAQNGLYKSVTVVVPDIYGLCLTQPYGGTNASGAPTCILNGEAVVGNPGGKYAVFVTVNDIGQQNRINLQAQHLTKYAALDFFLYEQ